MVQYDIYNLYPFFLEGEVKSQTALGKHGGIAGGGHWLLSKEKKNSHRGEQQRAY